MSAGRPAPLAVVLPSLVGGGAERVTLNVAKAAAQRGVPVDLVLGRAAGPYMSDVPETIRIVDLEASRMATALPSLVRYLRRVRPAAMLSAISHANVVALWARRLAGTPDRVVVAEHDTLSHVTQQTQRRRARLMPRLIGMTYPGADGIIAVSAGVADDLAASSGLPRERIEVVYNPVVTPEVLAAAHAPISDEWLQPGAPPVVMGVGRLTKKKDFPTLLAAFAEVRRTVDVRLMILGEGPERDRLQAQVRHLDIGDDVALPGFVENPYAHLNRAALFVLSSQWEGLPTVLIEAMCCGVPVVATDCPSGPSEILAGGAYGRLVPVGDAQELARAIVAGLAGEIPVAPSASWRRFELDAVVDRYLELTLPA